MENSGIKSLTATRRFIYSFVENLDDSRLLKIPDGFHTNIFWNIGHILVSQQLLNYQHASVPLLVNDTLLGLFRKGTSPNDWPDDWKKTPDKNLVFELFLTLPGQLQKDYAKNAFSDFQAYPTSSGFVLENIDDSIAYNNFHEGLHLGIIQTLLKFV